MNTSTTNLFDTIEKLIFDEGWRIKTIDFHPDLDVMIVVLNTKAILQFSLSSFKNLKAASKDVLDSYELIGDGVGVSWTVLNEDLSLKGFLQMEIKNRFGKQFGKAAA